MESSKKDLEEMLLVLKHGIKVAWTYRYEPDVRQKLRQAIFTAKEVREIIKNV